MQPIQYTIRNIPEPVDKALKLQAKHTGKSFNQTVVDALKKAVGTDDKPAKNHDFDWFIHSGVVDGDAFDQVLKEQRQIDPKLWK